MGREDAEKSRTSRDARVGGTRGRPKRADTKTGLWAKRDSTTGRFLDVKKADGSFKGVKRER